MEEIAELVAALDYRARLLDLLLQAPLTPRQYRHFRAAREMIRGTAEHDDLTKQAGALKEVAALVDIEMRDAVEVDDE